MRINGDSLVNDDDSMKKLVVTLKVLKEDSLAGGNAKFDFFWSHYSNHNEVLWYERTNALIHSINTSLSNAIIRHWIWIRMQMQFGLKKKTVNFLSEKNTILRKNNKNHERWRMHLIWINSLGPKKSKMVKNKNRISIEIALNALGKSENWLKLSTD